MATKKVATATKWLNYHHLFYFWTVAESGSVTEAARRLRLAQPTVSAQIKALEESLGVALIERTPRGLSLTPAGVKVRSYAQEIFSLGQELAEAVHGGEISARRTVRIGIADLVPKTVAYELVKPLAEKADEIRSVYREDHHEQLVSLLATSELDAVISDAPVTPVSRIKAFNHLLGESGISFLGPKNGGRSRKTFPELLNGAPMLLPTPGAAVRRELDRWFDEMGVAPNVIMEFQDSALLKVFAREGHGICPIPSVVERQVAKETGLHLLGSTTSVRERYYLITPERKVKDPYLSMLYDSAAEALSEAAR